MSYTSPRGGRRFFTAAGLDYTQPVEPMVSRDGLANNLLHLADQAHSKVWVNDMPSNSGLILGTNAGITANVPSAGTGEWWTVQVYGPFDLSVIAYKGERILYRVRVNINATAVNWTWLAKLCLPDETSAPDAGLFAYMPPDDTMLFVSAAGPAWLAPAPTGGLITPSRGLIDRARLAIRTLDGIGGEEAYVYTTAVCVKILAKGTSTDTLYGAHISEYLVLP
jgi:hypothetical protein